MSIVKNDFFPKQVSGLIQLNAIRLIGGLLLFFFAEHLVRKNCVEIVPFRFSGDLCLSLNQNGSHQCGLSRFKISLKIRFINVKCNQMTRTIGYNAIKYSQDDIVALRNRRYI